MCGEIDNEINSAEAYRDENDYPWYTYTKFTKQVDGNEVVAFLIEDTDDNNPYTRFDGVLDDGEPLGWDTEATIRAELAAEGFTEAPAESTTQTSGEGEPANA